MFFTGAEPASRDQLELDRIAVSVMYDDTSYQGGSTGSEAPVAVEALSRFDATGRSAEKPTSTGEDPTTRTRGIDDRPAPMLSTESGFTPPHGAPFCRNRDELQEYVLTARTFDAQGMSQLKSCALVKGGSKIAVIDSGGETLKGTHVDKVRIFGNGASMVGYTLTVDGRGP